MSVLADDDVIMHGNAKGRGDIDDQLQCNRGLSERKPSREMLPRGSYGGEFCSAVMSGGTLLGDLLATPDWSKQ
jgi:hypothetical protein